MAPILAPRRTAPWGVLPLNGAPAERILVSKQLADQAAGTSSPGPDCRNFTVGSHEMFKSIPILAGAAAGVSMAVAMGAPSPATLLAHATHATHATGNPAVCALHWTSTPRISARAEGPWTAQATDVRAGQHGCFDRLVVDLGPGTRPGYNVRYVRAVGAQGSGKPIPLRGRAKLEITVTDNAASGFPATGSGLADVSGFRAFRQVAGAGSVEGYTEIGLGVRARLPFRVHIMNGPGHDSRLVIDVAHRR